MRWTRIGTRQDFTEGTGRTLRLKGIRIAIFRKDDRFYAVDAICPHAGADLGSGRLRRGQVICPDHGWRFDLVTGQMPGMEEIAIRTFPIKVDEECVFISLPGLAEIS